MTEKGPKFCMECGAKVGTKTDICPSCGIRVRPYIPLAMSKSKPDGGGRKWLIVVAVVIVLLVIGGSQSNNKVEEDNSIPSLPTVQYEWEKIFEYDTEKVVIFRFNDPLDIFTLPKDTEKFKVEIEWMDGSKDNSLTVSVFKWDEVQDIKLIQWTNVKLTSIDSTPKSGTKTLDFDRQSGDFYVNIAGAASCRFTIEAYAWVPA